MNNTTNTPATYTSYVVRDGHRRQYLNESSPRGRWGRFGEASIYHNESDANRTALVINNSYGRDRAQVIPITFFKRT